MSKLLLVLGVVALAFAQGAVVEAEKVKRQLDSLSGATLG
nr:venom polypeptide precursor [Doratifera vulnerans]